jgi:hypothetical protein
MSSKQRENNENGKREYPQFAHPLRSVTAESFDTALAYPFAGSIAEKSFIPLIQDTHRFFTNHKSVSVHPTIERHKGVQK